MNSKTSGSAIQITTEAGKPFLAGQRKFTPLSQVVKFHPPGTSAVIQWSHPAGLLVQSEDTADQVLPIHDLTRWVQAALIISGVIIAGLFILIKPRAR